MKLLYFCPVGRTSAIREHIKWRSREHLKLSNLFFLQEGIPFFVPAFVPKIVPALKLFPRKIRLSVSPEEH